jgi:ABC-type multidrug transport system ATPase subunit
MLVRARTAACAAGAFSRQAPFELRAARLLAGGQVVLRDVAVAATCGEIVGVAGPNGAGKSTLLRSLAGLPCGPDVSREVPGEVGRCGTVLVGHDPALHAQLSLAENLELAVALTAGRRGSVGGALRRVGLQAAATRPAGACSAGMLRRAGLARAWACRPGLLLLDEPTAGLDGASRTLPADLARETAGAGGIVFVATHDRQAFEGVADRWLQVAGGRLCEERP